MKTLTITLTALALMFIWNKGLQAKIEDDLNSVQLDNPVVVELFTSQSCSSCPPADEILMKISDKPNIIPLAFHVTYWNHLSWEDTLSKEFSTKRQRGYSASAGSKRVYTPQMIVNGRTEFVGSHGNKLIKALKNTRPIQTLEIARDSAVINIKIPTMANQKSKSRIWLFATQSDHTQSIPSGENSGKSVHYVDAVLYEESLGDWDGRGKIITAQIPRIENIDAITILIQQNGFGPILAAGKIKL